MTARSIATIVTHVFFLAACATEVGWEASEPKGSDVDPDFQLTSWKLTIEEVVRATTAAGEEISFTSPSIDVRDLWRTELKNITLTRRNDLGSSQLDVAQEGPANLNLTTDACVFAGELTGGFPEHHRNYVAPSAPNLYTIHLWRGEWGDDPADLCLLTIPRERLEEGTFDLELECAEREYDEGRAASLLDRYFHGIYARGRAPSFSATGTTISYTFRIKAERTNAEQCAPQLSSVRTALRVGSSSTGESRWVEGGGVVHVGTKPGTVTRAVGHLTNSYLRHYGRFVRPGQAVYRYFEEDELQLINVTTESVRLLPGAHSFRTLLDDPLTGGRAETVLVTEIEGGQSSALELRSQVRVEEVGDHRDSIVETSMSLEAAEAAEAAEAQARQ